MTDFCNFAKCTVAAISNVVNYRYCKEMHNNGIGQVDSRLRIIYRISVRIQVSVIGFFTWVGNRWISGGFRFWGSDESFGMHKVDNLKGKIAIRINFFFSSSDLKAKYLERLWSDCNKLN